MKRVSAAALMCWVALSSVGVGATTEATTKHHAVKAKKAPIRYAPADEYFGPLKLSLLGIRNQLHDLSLQYDVNPDTRKAIYGKACTAEICLRDWEKKYPTDPALARDVYLLGHLYGKIGLEEAQKREPMMQHWLLVRYPATWYAKDEKKRIAYEKTHPHQEVHAQPTPQSPATLAPVGALEHATQVPSTPIPLGKHEKHASTPDVAVTPAAAAPASSAIPRIP